MQDLKGEISVRNLHFRYPTRKNDKVLKGLSFDVKAGYYINREQKNS